MKDDKVICGELIYGEKKYYFDFRNNILVIQPEKMMPYMKWYIERLADNESYFNERVNLVGETNEGKYICFINVKFARLGRGNYQAFVPAYVIGTTNGLNPIPQCTEITEMIFTGKCLDKFYYPKKNIKRNDVFNEEILKLEADYKNWEKEKFSIDNDIFSYYCRWTAPMASDINNVLNVNTILNVQFGNPKDINEIIEYYMKIEKLFSFINNRRVIIFNELKLIKKEPISYGFNGEEEIHLTPIEFDLYVTESEEETDIIEDLNCIRLEDIKHNYIKLYREVIKKDFSTYYYPTCQKENSYVDNNKFSQVSTAFETELSMLFPDFKSSVNSEYKEIKKGILKHLYNKKHSIKNQSPKELTSKQVRSLIKYCDYFSNIVNKIDGTLEEKIGFSFERYSTILITRRKKLLSFYKIKEVKDTLLAKSFVERRNKIAHGSSVDKFTDLEIISYSMIRICIYCITLERCNFTFEEIDKIVNKIF